MEPEASLPYSEGPTIRANLQPVESLIVYLKVLFNIILLPTLPLISSLWVVRLKLVQHGYRAHSIFGIKLYL